jgi:hypothetical protein
MLLASCRHTIGSMRLVGANGDAVEKDRGPRASGDPRSALGLEREALADGRPGEVELNFVEPNRAFERTTVEA